MIRHIKHINLKYLISSNVKYYKKTLSKILPSICGQVDPKNVIVTIGGQKTGEDVGVKTFWTSHNSFEYVSLINFVEIEYIDCDYVFLLHDTMVCGDEFSKLSSRIKYNEDVIMAHQKGWCNLGAFKTSFLFSIKELLFSMKNINKNNAIKMEGKFFGSFSTYKNPTVDFISDYQKSPYEGSDRSVCKFNSVDVYKYGSNDLNLFENGVLNTKL